MNPENAGRIFYVLLKKLDVKNTMPFLDKYGYKKVKFESMNDMVTLDEKDLYRTVSDTKFFQGLTDTLNKKEDIDAASGFYDTMRTRNDGSWAVFASGLNPTIFNGVAFALGRDPQFMREVVELTVGQLDLQF